jgi:hypothetical protein
MKIKYSKILRFTFPILLIVIFLLGCQGKTQYPISIAQLEGFTDCEKDTDCIFVNNGCCDCANGGIEVAINAALLPDFQNLFDCSDVLCTEMARTPACGSGTVTCGENNKCKYDLSSE